MNHIGAAAIDGKELDDKTSEPQQKALELKLFYEQKDTIKPASAEEVYENKEKVTHDKFFNEFAACLGDAINDLTSTPSPGMPQISRQFTRQKFAGGPKSTLTFGPCRSVSCFARGERSK